MNTWQRAGLGCAVLAGAGLGVAIASESFGGLVPCALCLVERWPYRLAIGLGVLAAVVPRAARWIVAAGALTMAAAAALGAVHVGVEQGFWPSPLPECAAPSLGNGTASERLSRMPARPAKPCDEPTYLIPAVPLSMAAMNLIYAATIAAGLGLVAARRSLP